MFDESNLHSLITRESRQRIITLGTLIRESLKAAVDDRFAVCSEMALSVDWRERVRHLAAVAEQQRDWGWWQKPPWSELKLLLVKEAEYLAWLDQATDRTSEAVPIGRKPEPRPKNAPEVKIDQVITAEYELAKQRGLKPPNLKEIIRPVQARLRAEGYYASGRQIQKLAEAEKYRVLRRPPGRTLTADRAQR